jgi:hypothetical protein
LKRYRGKKFGGLNQNFGKIQWHIWKYRMLGGPYVKKDRGIDVIWKKSRGLDIKRQLESDSIKN